MEDVIVFSNTRGFRKNKIGINKLVEVHKPIVFLVAEHFQSKDLHLQVDGYILAASYCRFTREKGGVAIFVREDVEFKSRKDLDTFNFKNQFEIRSVEITTKNLVVTVVYRPPSGKLKVFHEKLDNVLKLCNEDPTRRYVLAGDFNVNNCERNSTMKILENNSFKFTFSSKTHEAGGCLDNFIVNFQPSNQNIMEEKLSDHNCVRLVLPDLSKDLFHQTRDKPESLEYEASIEKGSVNTADSTPSDFIDQIAAFHSDPILKMSTKSNIINIYPKPSDFVANNNYLTSTELPTQSTTQFEEYYTLQMETIISKCIFENSFLEKLAIKDSGHLRETLDETLESLKEQVQVLQYKIKKLEDRIVILSDKLHGMNHKKQRGLLTLTMSK